MNICVIPARGGSKRIPRKNIRNFCGKPMISWSIEAAQKAGCFDRIIVSTDDVEIADVARAAGAEVPFMRPQNISDDFSTTGEVVIHAIDTLTENGGQFDAVCCLYATAPFVDVKDILIGLKSLETHKFAFPVTSFAFPIQRAVKMRPEGGLEMFHPEHSKTRSQDLTEAYHDAGQFYWARPQDWRAGGEMFGPDTLPVILPRWRVQDIDTPEDWTRAEAMFKALGLDK